MADQKLYTVEELLELAHKHKALRIKAGPVEIELSHGAFDPPPESAVIDSQLGPSARIPGPDEMLFMAGLEFEPAEPKGKA